MSHSKLPPSDIANYVFDAQRQYLDAFKPPDRETFQSADIKDASDIIGKAEKGKWGKNKGIGTFDSTLPPADTEQIMRELKVAGSYMSRDISRAGVEFNVKQVPVSVEAKARLNQRISIYRRIYEAWRKYGRMNEGAKKAAAMFGVNGDIQADAKRALFDMRLPGVIVEAHAALARGEQVVISVVSVSGVDGETGSLVSAISKINTQKVEKLGQGENSAPEDIPEALVDIVTLQEDLKDLPQLPSPIDVLRDTFKNKVAFVTGATSTKDRVAAQQDFQANKLDVIVISGAGKTGINRHDISGKRKIHLIVADYEWSATNFKQELGRVDRTGQRTSPIVTVMHTGSAGERKFIATISNRMKGLGAVSKSGAESTCTGLLTDEFELGTTIDPSVQRDLALIVKEDDSASEIINCIKSSAEPALQEVIIFDIYRGKGVEEGSKSVALSLIMQDDTQTLTDSEIDAIVSRLLTLLNNEKNAKLRD